MLSMTEVSILAVLGLVGWYYLLVPSNNADLGSLSTVSDPRTMNLIQNTYPIPLKQNMAALTHGLTHFFLTGPVDGKRIVLIHGITVTAASFPQVITRLAERGFYVLSYDLYGMGHSSSPGIPYTAETYALQLRDILNHVEKLVLVAPAGLKKGVPGAARIFEVPSIGEVLFYLVGRRVLGARTRKHEKGLIAEPYKSVFIAMQRLNIYAHPGFLRTYYQIIRNGPMRFMEPLYESVGKKLGNRVLCIWGRQDTTAVFSEESPVFRNLMPDAQFLELEGRHTILAEGVEAVDAIRDFCV
ncbi:Alpha/Beta hydrolase protein [Chytriomyces cf. hyalinus JEL632]|nr:Alpha/Beta hydrolase protein [Chytriomyces cf. hyalinus JEL632]